MAIRRLEALELSETLGAMLGSVVEAQEQSARATVDFIEDVGFEETAEGKRMRTVTVRYTKRDENDEFATFEVEVPLLSLVNIPSLAVREAKLSFSYDVVTANVGESNVSSTGSPKLRKAVLSGFVRSRPTGSGSERQTTSIDLDVTVEQQAIPIGVERLFDLAELGIAERPTSPVP